MTVNLRRGNAADADVGDCINSGGEIAIAQQSMPTVLIECSFPRWIFENSAIAVRGNRLACDSAPQGLIQSHRWRPIGRTITPEIWIRPNPTGDITELDPIRLPHPGQRYQASGR
jgi:hypothetical protein